MLKSSKINTPNPVVKTFSELFRFQINPPNLAGELVHAIRAKFDTVEFRGRNIRILEDDFGYVYSSAAVLKNGNTKWRCSKRNAYKCIAFINTRGDYIVRNRSEHNHDPANVHINRTSSEFY